MWTRVLWPLLAGALLLTTVDGTYGPANGRIPTNPFIRRSCAGGISCPSSVVSSGGCEGGSGCGGSGSVSPISPETTPTKKYWWLGEDSPFKLPAGHQITHQESNCGSSGCTATIQTCGGVGCPPASSNPFLAPPKPSRPQVVVPPAPTPAPSPVLTPLRPSLPSSPVVPSGENRVDQPMGQCPRAFVCVHWQLCRDGYVITDGSGRINKLIKTIPAQLATQFRSCGTDMLCCQVPSYNPPALGPTPSISFELPLPGTPAAPAVPAAPSLPAAPAVPAGSPRTTQPAPQGNIEPCTTHSPQTERPPSPATSRPVTTPRRQTPTPSRPRSTPLRPATFPSSQTPGSPPRPPAGAPSPARPVFLRPNGPRPQPTVINQANPLVPARPVAAPAPPQPTQPRQLPTPAPRPAIRPRPPGRTPSGPGPSQGIISNPLGLVSPPSPQPMGMPGMPGMPMGMMAAAPPGPGGTCSAGTYCVERSRCNPYTGFIINDPNQLMAVWRDAPTVPELPCFIPGGVGIQDGICCQQSHPRPGMNGMPGAD